MAVSDEQEEGGRCRITELPNCVMESIVSLLPPTDAVNTILACPPRWKTLSRSMLTRRNLEFFNVPDLEIFNVPGSNHALVYSMGKTPAFVRRVRDYLQQYQGNKVDSFRLQCYNNLDSEFCCSLDEWIRFALSKGVEEIHLAFGCHVKRKSRYVFPPRLQVGSTIHLKHLSLEKCILRLLTTGFDEFSRLTTLCLKEVTLDPSQMANLFSVCVLLESLTLIQCGNLNCDAAPVVAGDRLTHLKLLHCMEGTKLEISALNLASLEYIPCCDCMLFSLETPSLTRSFFSTAENNVEDSILPHALMQFASCPGLETLHLQMPTELPRISSIPTYENLKQLNLDINLSPWYRGYDDQVDVNCVLDILKAAPFLEELVILAYGGILYWTNPSETRNHSTFTNNHLRMAEIQGVRGDWYEKELAICILESSPKLEMLVINRLPRYYEGDGVYSNWQHENFSELHMRLWEEELKSVKTNALQFR